MDSLKRYRKLIYLFVILSIGIFYSCGDSIQASFDKELKDVDMVKIYFYENGNGKSGKDKIASVQDKNVIDMLKSSVMDDTAEQPTCGYSGSMEFFRKNVSVSNMEFSTDPGCERIVFRLKDNMYSKKLSPEGVKLINEIYTKVDLQNKADLLK
ncbi:hypothetical protein BH10BAC5_BH10BAC5_09170 [soil metagenome]